MTPTYLAIRGLRAPVQLVGDDWSMYDLDGYFVEGSTAIGTTKTAEPFATLVAHNGHILFKSDFIDEPVIHTDVVNAMCDLVACTAQQRTVESTTDMCLHAAAVQIGNGLTIFPAERRAGKSLLTAAFAASGHKVFNDDVLPIRSEPGNEMLGIATGASIRLRLPLPDATPTSVIQHIAEFAGPDNGQYRYLPSPSIATADTTAPLKAFVRLTRNDTSRATFGTMSRGQMLRILLRQNFSREANADHILSALVTLATTLPSFELSYSNIDEAQALLDTHLKDLLPTHPVMPEIPPTNPIDLSFVPDPACRVTHSSGAVAKSLDGEIFATSSDMRRILYLDEGATRIWTLLSEPTSQTEATEIIATAFPDASKEKIATDTAAIFERLGSLGLISPA